MSNVSLILAGSLLTLGHSSPGSLNEDVSPTVTVAIHKGILAVVSAERYALDDEQRASYLLEAIEQHFSLALAEEPDNETALLFRALATGQLAHYYRRLKYNAEIDLSELDTVAAVRRDPAKRGEIQGQLDRWNAVLASDPAPPDRRVAEAGVASAQAKLDKINTQRGTSSEALAAERRRVSERLELKADEERKCYRNMIGDLAALERVTTGLAAHEDLMVALAHTKIAQIADNQARRTGDAERTTTGALREEARLELETAGALLEGLLQQELDPELRLRTQFFLGVVRYRLAVPFSLEGRLSRNGQAYLAGAEEVLTELVHGRSVDDRWSSYAHFYLAVIRTFQANELAAARRREALLDDASRHLSEAAILDHRRSDDLSLLPELISRQQHVITSQRQRQFGRVLAEDIRLSFYAGTRYDTNVVLLGERTDLARGVSDESDFGFTAGASIDYTRDLTNELTVGVQLATSWLWNVDVQEFDEEGYGFSTAFLYELVPDTPTSNVGPVNLFLQYDLDYVLLGRSRFLESQALSPTLQVDWGELNSAVQREHRTELTVLYEDREYYEREFDKRFNRDGTYVTIGVTHRHRAKEMTSYYRQRGIEPWGAKGDDSLVQEHHEHPDRHLTTMFGVTYAWDSTDGDEFDRKAPGLLLGAEVPLPWGLLMNAGATLEWEDYRHPSLVDFHRRSRRDFVQTYRLGLSRQFVLREGEQRHRFTPEFDRVVMTLQAHAAWTDDDSNVVDRLGQAIFSYDRSEYGFFVMFEVN